MDMHKNARLTPKGREAMVRAVVDDGLSRAEAARRFNTTPKTVDKRVERYRKQGVDGLRDRSSRPHCSPDQTAAVTCDAIETLRRQRYTIAQIAARAGASSATVSRVLRRRRADARSCALPPRRARRRTTAAVTRSF
jgi:transposase